MTGLRTGERFIFYFFFLFLFFFFVIFGWPPVGPPAHPGHAVGLAINKAASGPKTTVCSTLSLFLLKKNDGMWCAVPREPLLWRGLATGVDWRAGRDLAEWPGLPPFPHAHRANRLAQEVPVGVS